MYIAKKSNHTHNKYSQESAKDNPVDADLNALFTAIQGRLRFGSGTSGVKGENIGGAWLRLLTSGTSDAEVGYKHLLQSQPMGYIVIWQDKSGSLYANPLGEGVNTVWTSGTAYFKSNATAGNFLVFLLERGGQ